MSLPNRFDLTIEQGSTFKYWFAVRDTDGVIVDLGAEGYNVAHLQVRDRPASQGGTLQIEFSNTYNGYGLIVLGLQYDLPIGDPNRRQWSGYIYASAPVTANLRDWGLGGYNFEISKSSTPDEVITIMRGTAALEPEWTTP